MKKMFCMLLTLVMLFASSALALTFDEGADLIINYVKESMEAAGRTFWFTECDAAKNQKFSKALDYDYHARTSKDGKTFCTVKGHGDEMEIFTAETSVRDNYEDMVAAAMSVMELYLGKASPSMVRWVNETGREVLAKSEEDKAFMYELKGGAFFYMQQWHETNYTRKPHYSVSMVFPCTNACAMTRTVESMKQDVEGTCPDCQGTGKGVAKRSTCPECDGAGRSGMCTSCRGVPLCTVCHGAGQVEMYNYVMEFYYYRTCGGCGGSGGCRSCNATGWTECRRCSGLGQILGTASCERCRGTGKY